MAIQCIPVEWMVINAADSFDTISTANKKIKSSEYKETGQYPVIDQGQKYISGYIDDDSNLIMVNNPLVVFGDHTKAMKLVDFNFVPGADGTKILNPKGFVEPTFFYYQLKNLNIPDKGYSRHFKFFKELDFALPPMTEQKEISDRLDTLLVQVEATQARLARISSITKQFRQSVLAAAVSGRLTSDWIEQHEIHESAMQLKKRWLEERESWFHATQQELLKTGKIKKIKPMPLPVLPDMDTATPESIPEHWIFISVNEFAQCFDNMRIPVKKEARLSNIGLYPYFGANGEVDRVDEFIFDDDLVLVTEDETFYGREKPIAYRYTGKCWVNNHAHVLKAMTKEANDYLCYALMYYKVIPWLTGTTGRAKLTQAALNSLPIGLPPYNELVEIVRRVEQLFAYADSIEQQAKTAKAQVDKLTQAILAKAFRGELTADWRAANPDLISGDNSAAALLARIQAERATAKPRKRASKPTISPTSSGVTQ